MDAPTLIGSAGVSLLLVAFLLQLGKAIRGDGWPYLVLNFVGAALAGYSSWLIRFMPFVILEGTWAMVALFGLVRRAQMLHDAKVNHH